MNIAILGTRGIPAQYGGFETFTEQLAVRLARKEASVTVYCVSDRTNRPESYKGIKLVYLSNPRLGPLTTILFDLRCLWHARKGFDVVYMLGYGASVFCFIPRLWKTTVWINMDGIEWARAKWGCIARAYFKIMEAIAMRTADRVIADAESIKDLLYRRHRVSTPCSVIPYGATVVEETPTTVFLDDCGLQKNNYYLIVCRLEPENHIREILSGYIASKSRFPLVVIGDHRISTEYAKQLLTIHDSRIRFLGTLYDQGRLLALRYHCRAYFHGHSVGGTNPSLLEALGCGNIVIAHDNLFNREVAQDAAFYFQDQGVIPHYLEKIGSMDDQHLLERHKRSKQRIRDHYTWGSIAERYMTILREDTGTQITL